MKRLIIFLLLATAGLGAAEAEPAKKMNVLFIISDDMNNDLGTYGHPFVKSPNIDKLAARGVRFDRAYCQFPWCAPSRASFMTGLRPDTTKVMDLTYHFRQGMPDVVTMPQAFMKAGYFAARVGKVYHYGNPGDIGTSGADDPASWNQVVNPAGRDKTTLESDILVYPPTKGLASSMSLLADPVGTDEEHTDGKVATEAIKLLEENKNRPFFLAVGFYKPHCPWVAPKKWFDMYQVEQEILPAIAPNWRSTVPAAVLDTGAEWPYRGVTPEQARESRRAYHATISYVDSQIGRVVDALDRLGLADNTVIVFISDHGYHLGEHGLWMKQTCFEEAAKVPMIIAAPRASANGKATKRTIELVDIYPTLTDLAGVKAPDGLEGVSLRPLLENADAVWNRAAYTQTVTKGKSKTQGYSVRTERWRFIEWQYGEMGMQLYDHEKDPQELNNLANDPAYASVVAEMKALSKKVHPVMVVPGVAK